MLIPTVFVSYARQDAIFVERVIDDLTARGIGSWVDTSKLEVGDKLSNITTAVSQSTLVFAYITRSYLESKWCMQELELARVAPRLTLAPYVDRQETLEKLPEELRDDVSFGVLDGAAGYNEALSQLARKAWTSLQTAERLVPAADHILASPAVFSSRGYSQEELLDRVKQELILAGSNLRNWLTDRESRERLQDLVSNKKQVRLTLVLGTYDALAAISPEGAAHLEQSVLDIKEMLDGLDPEERRRVDVHFHVGVVTLSAVFVDPRAPDGILFFSPRWTIQFVPHDRFSCVIDKTINSLDLYNAIYGGVTLMIQRDAKTLEEMLQGIARG